MEQIFNFRSGSNNQAGKLSNEKPTYSKKLILHFLILKQKFQKHKSSMKYLTFDANLSKESHIFSMILC